MQGIIVGIITFFLIGLFHPIVIKGEYYLGRKMIIVVCLGGIVAAFISILGDNLIRSIIWGVISCCCFWGIHEILEQEKRVLKGWFPENPRRKAHYDQLRIKQKSGYSGR